MKIYIKFMVSSRCKSAVKEILRNRGLHFMVVDLGEVDVMENITDEQREQIRVDLFNAGLELMDDKKATLIELIKKEIIEIIYTTEESIKISLTDYLSQKLNHTYAYLSGLFSEVLGTTIEQFIIAHKIERIKEMIMYGDLNLTEIAWRMNYSSNAHLSNQFKKVTGLTPSHFKRLKIKKMIPIEEVGIPFQNLTN